ncbi:MAG: ParA family protein [Solobacterium sp.]|jgi:chromosome partitioning protein|nr:ParA family protein [Solobacterium sp.]MBR3343728.1 ParA family protein [Solobacterium sp.]HAE16476.1 sporulation initiation inhibitor Soj [Erysipelotrichaceae bacterium]
MGKIIAVANQKGGVGKTTTSINLSAGLAYANRKILLVDFDPQGNATHGIGANRVGFDRNHTVYDVLVGTDSVRQNAVRLDMPPLDVLPATIDLSGADVEMASSNYAVGRENLLKQKLDAVRNDYDYIIIDCPPSLGLLNTNALTAADTVMIPVQCEYFALEGLTQLLGTIRLVQKLWNPRLSIEGVLLTMFDVRTKLSVEVQQEVRKYFKEKVYRCYIPRNVRLSEAPSREVSIFEYDTKSEGAKAYASLVREVISHNEKGGR